MGSEPTFTFFCERRGCGRSFVVFREHSPGPRMVCPVCQEDRLRWLEAARERAESVCAEIGPDERRGMGPLQKQALVNLKYALLEADRALAEKEEIGG